MTCAADVVFPNAIGIGFGIAISKTIAIDFAMARQWLSLFLFLLPFVDQVIVVIAIRAKAMVVKIAIQKT